MIPYYLSDGPVGEWFTLPTTECPGDPDAAWPCHLDEKVHELCGGSGRVPVELTWPCPTCGGSGQVEDLAEKAMGYHTKTVCSDCTDGRVSFGPLAVGVAAHKCDASGCGDGYHEPAGCPNCIDCTEPAALTENITVQAYPVVEYADAYEGPCIEKNHGRITWWADPFDQRGTEPEDITDQFPVLPKPGDTVCRVIERRALTEPITEYPHSVEWRGHTAQMATVPLPQGVGSGCTEPTRR